ncbi:hypothetical protein PVAND_004076 [Polypedilum vanderplanki]|uniref:Uncharacterized protein n=1 Tax=Polypedilum vanderplanki TaxID=319348 RepID=A0A9J6BWI5_POLVA|nr:hypothetical protein PVAND_004076 [Polypedilum vanderplanki]
MRFLPGPVLLNYDPMITITSNQSVKNSPRREKSSRKNKTKTILRKLNNECLAVLEESPGVEICEWFMEDNIGMDPVTIDMPIDVDCDTLPLISIKENFNVRRENIN